MYCKHEVRPSIQMLATRILPAVSRARTFDLSTRLAVLGEAKEHFGYSWLVAREHVWRLLPHGVTLGKDRWTDSLRLSNLLHEAVGQAA
jgi:hypothetical protein